MKLVKIDPPGSFCQYQAILDRLHGLPVKSFIEVGCGAGELSALLCSHGLTGAGVDFSPAAISLATERLEKYIQQSQYTLYEGEIRELAASNERYDLGISVMVMEHVENEQEFLRSIQMRVKPGGYVLIGVPGRRDCWSIEDDTVGHLRRYDRDDLKAALEKAGLSDVEVWSVAVPIANLLFHLGNFMISRSQTETRKMTQSQREQTETSGIREIPFKTVFPPAFKLILNPVTLAPLFWIQRLFYRSNLGLTMLGIGQVPPS